MNRNIKIAALIVNMISALTVIIGIAMTIVFYQNAAFLVYYTQDSNIFALLTSLIFCVYLIRSIKDENYTIPKWLTNLKFISTCCVTVTLMVVLTVLAPSNPNILEGYISLMFKNTGLFLHFLCPVLQIVSFILLEPKLQKGVKIPFKAIIPTLIYAAVLIPLNIIGMVDGPYFFLKVTKQPVYMTIIWFCVILGANFLFALLLKFINKKISKAE